MKMDIKPSAVTITFEPDKYFLVFHEGKYSLNYRIDRSEKGKNDDVGTEVLLLDEVERDVFAKAGFTQVEF